MEENRKKKLRWQLPFLVLLIAGCVYTIRSQQNIIPFQKENGSIFGTIYNITYQSDTTLHEEILAELNKVNMSLSPFEKNSIITKINNNEKVIADSLFIHVFNLSQKVSAETNGAFDITVAPLVNAWGFGFKNSNNIKPEQIDSILQFVGYNKIKMENGTVIKSDPRIILDCSAVAKGYGSDVVAKLFDSKGIKNYMIEIGGEIVVKGTNPQQKNWRVGVNKPIEDSLNTNSEIQTILNVTNLGMATSGNYRNFYYKDGKKYAHTIDPHTGYPVQHSILSSTVLAKDCATADAYATAFMVLGLEKAKKILEKNNEIEAYLIYADEKGNNQVYMTPGMEKMTEK